MVAVIDYDSNHSLGNPVKINSFTIISCLFLKLYELFTNYSVSNAF